MLVRGRSVIVVVRAQRQYGWSRWVRKLTVLPGEGDDVLDKAKAQICTRQKSDCKPNPQVL